jgi:signal transduction histidine kinase
VTDPDGAPCAILALHDLRPQRLAADQQRQALLHAEASSRTKTMFLAGVSHELRTPLNAILGYGEMLGEDLEDPDQQEDVGRILAAGRHLLALIDDVLDISQVESGRLDIVEEPVDLAAVFEELEAACRPALRRSGHRLAVDLPAGLPSARADRNRVRQVLANLVGNAIKYTPAGAIDLAVRCDGTWLRVEVVDDGPGLDEELLPTLFEPFRRGRHDVQGTGLGLALSRTLAEGMGGTLTAANHARRGARFTLELRAGRRPSRLGPAASGPPDAVHGARKPFHTQFTAAPSAPHTGR